MPWQWLNEYKIVEGLQKEGDAAKAAVMDALDTIIESPFQPSGIQTHVLPATLHAAEELRIAWLPHGYVLTFRPFVNGPPPLAGQHVSIRDLRHYQFLDDRFKEQS